MPMSSVVCVVCSVQEGVWFMITGCFFSFCHLKSGFDHGVLMIERAGQILCFVLPILWHGVEIPCTFLLLILDRRNDGEVT